MPLLAMISASMTLASFTIIPVSDTSTVIESPLRVSTSLLTSDELGADVAIT